MLAQTLVYAVAESDVMQGFAMDVELVRVGKLFRIAVCGADHGHDPITLADQLTTHLDVLHRHTRSVVVNDGVESQHLLDGVLHQRWVCDQRRFLIGME
ncbi:hypothetical protein D9M68_917520 [compost metagenome]